MNKTELHNSRQKLLDQIDDKISLNIDKNDGTLEKLFELKDLISDQNVFDFNYEFINKLAPNCTDLQQTEETLKNNITSVLESIDYSSKKTCQDIFEEALLKLGFPIDQMPWKLQEHIRYVLYDFMDDILEQNQSN